MAEVAEEQGRSKVALIGAIMAAPKEAIEQKVEDGILTQEPARRLGRPRVDRLPIHP